MRKIDVVFQKNLGTVDGGQNAMKTRFSCSFNAARDNIKKIVKMLVKFFTMRQVFTRSGQNWFQNRGISLSCPGFFVDATN
jgi:hypothetical protein